MATDKLYESACVHILNDAELDEEERTQRLETLLGKELGLTGKSLEDAVLDEDDKRVDTIE